MSGKNFTEDGTLHTCSYCGKKSLKIWSGMYNGRLYEICPHCFYNRKSTREVTGHSTIFDRLIDLCLWCIAVFIVILGFCIVIAFVGAIIIFIVSFIEGTN
jgi:hypothetical protein